MGASGRYVGPESIVTELHNVDLASYTTFGVHAVAPVLVTVESVDELKQALHEYSGARILGGGSNILVSHDVVEPIIRIGIGGRQHAIHHNKVRITIGAGEIWHSVVQWCVDNDWGGLENLALIPGTVGAAPMQNIGAYGVEQNSRFVELEAVDIQTLEIKRFVNEQCEFGYRNSIFKREFKGKVVITSVTYELDLPPHHVHHSYADVQHELGARESVTIQDVFNAVVAIRKRKLPDPAEIGNAGSFFKNPVMPNSKFQNLNSEFPEIPNYPQKDGSVKIPAAWLIDQCGWKGFRNGNVGVHERQALVIVNIDNAHGPEVLQLSQQIAQSVRQKFGIDLETEVNIW